MLECLGAAWFISLCCFFVSKELFHVRQVSVQRARHRLPLPSFHSQPLHVYTQAAQFRSGDVRLVGGSYQWEGRVEIFFNRSWGTITDSDWTSEDKQAVCRTMGYFRPGEIYCNNKRLCIYKRSYKTSLPLLVQGYRVKSCSNLIIFPGLLQVCLKGL